MIPFATYTAAESPLLFNVLDNLQKLPIPVTGSRHHQIHSAKCSHKSAPKRHLDRFSHF